MNSVPLKGGKAHLPPIAFDETDRIMKLYEGKIGRSDALKEMAINSRKHREMEEVIKNSLKVDGEKIKKGIKGFGGSLF